MNVAEFFVRHRVLAYMLNAAIILFGVISIRDIGTDRMPNVDYPGVVITTANDGASPEVVDNSITRVLESAVNTVPGIDIIHSTSWPGVSEVYVQFVPEKDPDIAFNEVQSKINQVLNELPREAERPVIIKFNPSDSPVLWLFLRGDRGLIELNRVAEEKISHYLENISGVGEVRIGGGRERKIRVDLDLGSLSALGLTAQDVISAFGREHIQVPGGYLVGGMQEKMLHLDMEYHSIRELGDLVIQSRDQVPIRLRDVASLTDGLDDKRGLSRFNGVEGIAIGIRKVRGANTVAIVKEVKQQLAVAVRPQLPDGVELLVVTDEADIISRATNALQNHILEGTLLAGVVVLLFLLNIPATLIISTAVPVSLAGAIVVLYFGDYTLNTITLSALLLLIGVVVDDAIVVLENIHRQHEAGVNDPDAAAIQGTREVIFAVMAASLTLVCIFGTVIFTEGMFGIFIRSFATVVVMGVLSSVFVSLTLTPVLCSRFLRYRKTPGRWVAPLERAHKALENRYRRLLVFSLERRGAVLLGTLLLVASSSWFVTRLGAEFFPADDEARFEVILRAPLGTSIDYMVQKLDAVEAILRDDPAVSHIFSTVGYGRGAEVNEATLGVMLLPRKQRSASQAVVMARTHAALEQVVGVEVYLNNYPIAPGVSPDTFEGYITGPGMQEVAHYAEQMLQRLREHDGMDNIHLELDLALPQLTFDVDRNRAKALGISSQQIGDTVRVLVGGADIAKYHAIPGDGERYDVRLAAQRGAMRDIRDLENVYLKSADGKLVRLAAVVEVRETVGPASLERLNLSYSAGFVGTPEGIAFAEALEIFRQVAAATLPAGMDVQFIGASNEMERTTRGLIFVFITGMVLVYMVLASQFNSFLQPALVMLAQPMAIAGGVIALWVTGLTLNVFSMIGLILLVGLVAKNSILLVDLVNRYRAQGMETHAAILQACPRRMRPVVMTSLTVVLAMTPAALGVGTGAAQYGSMAVAVIGGMVFSTLLTLVVVPTAYSLLERWLVAVESLSSTVQLPAGSRRQKPLPTATDN